MYTAAELAAKNPVLLRGEVAYEADTTLFKVGDGTTHWNDLPYRSAAEGGGKSCQLPAGVSDDRIRRTGHLPDHSSG